jgi:hypothetical protein
MLSQTTLIIRHRRALGWFYNSISRLKIIPLYFT